MHKPVQETGGFVRIHPDDTVAVALSDQPAGALAAFGGGVTLSESVPAGHKVALARIGEGDEVIKFGFPIGRATSAIEPGMWVHSHNLRTTLEGKLAYAYTPRECGIDAVADGKTFDGFPRPDGGAGIRNEIWILPTVGCVNRTAEVLARQADAALAGDAVDGVYAFPHPYGCSQLGDDLETTRNLLAALARHPNAGGVLILGLGCENNTHERFRVAVGDHDPDRLRFLSTQEVEDELETGMTLLEELVRHAGRFKRAPMPLSRLRVGLKCGGSDGYSGITANPLLGAFSDRLIARGGATALTEVPEMFGAETILMERCADRGTFQKCVDMINGYKDRFNRHGISVYENASPGNREGGLTTPEEKSLGCIQKGGTGPVVDVLGIGEPITKPGLSLVDGPGNDLVSVTVLSASGAQMVLFTTGRGTPFGGAVPTLKVATNPRLAAKKRHWIDFSAAPLIEGATLDALADALLEQVIEVASGRLRTRNEINGFHEIALFKDGVTL